MSDMNNILSVEDIDFIFSIIDEGQKAFLNECASLLSLADKLAHTKEEFLKKIPFPINVIEMAARGKLKETAHSAILQRLLTKQEILESFIKEIVGLYPTGFMTNDVELPDTNRIDVCINGDKYCIIVENKVNSAVEQPGQIYRYVNVVKEKGYEESNIYVVYLNPNHYAMPSDYSLTEDGKGEKRIPEDIEQTRLIIKSYSRDIYNWIKKVFDETPKDKSNAYLLSALHQYLNYLENFFYLTDEYKDMNDELRKTLLDRLSGTTPEDRIKELNSMREKITILQIEIEKLTRENQREIDTNELVQIAPMLTKEIGLKQNLCTLFNQGLDEKGLGVILNKDGKNFMVVFYDEGNNFYFGVVTCGENQFDPQFKESINENMSSIVLSVKSQAKGRWIAWGEVEKDNEWMPKFKKLVDKCERLI